MRVPIERAAESDLLFADTMSRGFVVFRATVDDTHRPLLPAEAAFTGTMSPRRLATFVAGRAAAHAALDHLGLGAQAITVGAGGEPRWPSGVVGSITHTDRVAYAVVALEEPEASIDGGLALGIDIEDRRRLTPEIIPTIMTERERARWADLEPAEADAFATTVFSAKEALYKAQYHFTEAWLGFEHVTLGDSRPVGAASPPSVAPPSAAPPSAAPTGLETQLVETPFVEAPGSPLGSEIERPMSSRSLIGQDEILSAVVLRRRASRARSR